MSKTEEKRLPWSPFSSFTKSGRLLVDYRGRLLVVLLTIKTTF